jgi:transposase
MSTSPYSKDLREKVINFLKLGKSQTEASIVFGINRMTVNKWHLRYKNEGHYLPKVRLGAKSNIEPESFIEYVKNHPDSRSEDIAREFGISASGARYWLRRVGFSYKKKRLPMWKQVKKNELHTKKS